MSRRRLLAASESEETFGKNGKDIRQRGSFVFWIWSVEEAEIGKIREEGGNFTS